MDKVAKNECRDFFASLRDDIISARERAYQTVNRQLVELSRVS